ncbi:MAG: right-handed parallel beta-helix repeat-containing protein [Pseudomonadota bacterium]
MFPRALSLSLVLLIAVLETSAAATLTVDRTDHAPQASACTPAPLDCSLTGAIELANTMAGQDTVVLTADNFRLAQTGAGPVIRSEILILGSGMGQTVIEADFTYLNAAFEVRAGGQLTLQDLAISSFTNIDGGAVVVTGESSASAELERVTVTNSRGNSMGGGVTVRPPLSGVVEPDFRLRIVDSVIRNNLAEGQDGGLNCAGAGLGLHNGPVRIENSEIRDNRAEVLARGGGICIGPGVDVTLEDSLLVGNYSVGLGGAIFSGGRLEVARSTFDRNAGSGAGIFALTGEVDVIGSMFLNNESASPSSATAISADALNRFRMLDSSILDGSAPGVAVRIIDSEVADIAGLDVSGQRTSLQLTAVQASVVENVFIDRSLSGLSALTITQSPNVVLRSLTVFGGGDQLTGNGGALRIDSAFVEVEDCLLFQNRATESGIPNSGDGGAIWVSDSTLVLKRCAIDSNVADGLGAGIYARDTAVVFTQSSVTRNFAQDTGGGIALVSGSTLVATNNTIGGNGSQNGVSALFAAGGTRATLEHVTVTGPEVFLGSPPPSIELIGATALFTNTAIAGSCSLFFSGSVPESGGGNVVDDASCLTPNSDDRMVSDLGILPLARVGTERLVHLPRLDSPLIDEAMDCASVDQRGNTRGTPCDTGAVERIPADSLVFSDSFELSGVAPAAAELTIP